MREKGYRSAAAQRLQESIDNPEGADEVDEMDDEIPEGPEGFNATAEDLKGVANIYRGTKKR